MRPVEAPARTSATWVAPKRPRSSTTPARIFSATPVVSPAATVSPRQTSQAPQPGGLVGLAEVGDERPVTADGVLTEGVHLPELAQRGRRRLGPLGGEDGLPQPVVAAAVQQQALGFQPVAAGPARLLLVVLERLGHAGVDDEAHVGAVDAHAEGDGGHHDVRPLVHEGVLVGPSLLVGEPGVIADRSQAPARERRGQLVHLGPADAVDDPRLAAVAPDGGQHLGQPIGARLDAIDEVGPIERADQHRGDREPQLGDDIGAHLRGGRRRVGVHGHPGERRPKPAELPILRPEIVAPLADAVGLVDGEERRPPPPQPLEEAVHHEPLGRHEEQPVAAGGQARLDGGALAAGLAAVDERRRHAGLGRPSTWSFMSAMSGEIDDGQALQMGRGRLVAE